MGKMKSLISGSMTGFVVSTLMTNISQETKYILIVLLFLIYAVCLVGYDKRDPNRPKQENKQGMNSIEKRMEGLENGIK